jgi:hypothetical protein
VTDHIDFNELDRRLAVFDPHLPREYLLDALRALPEAEASVVLYRRVAIGSAALALVASAITVVVLMIGTSHATEILTLRDQCISVKSAETLVKLTDNIAAVNATCIGYHQKDREFMQAVLARDGSYEDIDGGLRYEDVSTLPGSKAIDLILHREKSSGWPGILVQAVQQQEP